MTFVYFVLIIVSLVSSQITPKLEKNVQVADLKTADHISWDVNKPLYKASYCKASVLNTLCRYNCWIQPRCGDELTKTTFLHLSNPQRQYVTELHNHLRSYYVTNLRFAHAANISFHTMSYDFEVEFFANCYIKQCKYQPDFEMITIDGTPMKQNVYRETFSSTDHIEVNTVNTLLKNALDFWFKQHPLVNKSYLYDSLQIRKRDVMQFWQMVWPETRYVGCSYLITHRKFGTHSAYVYCNYKPAMTQDALFSYIRGEFKQIDEECEPNLEYTGLCGRLREFIDDEFRVYRGSSNCFTYSVIVWCSLAVNL